MKRSAAVCVAVGLFVSACGDGAKTAAGGASSQTTTGMAGVAGMAPHTDHMGNPTSDCSPSGSSLAITASGTKFDKDCLAAPASQAFTITYDNKDAFSHNLAILESHTATDVLFRAELVQGPKVQTFNVGALRPGVYAFHCEVHREKMSGAFIVK